MSGDLILTTCACGYAGYLPAESFCPSCGKGPAKVSEERVNVVTGKPVRTPSDPYWNLLALPGTTPARQTIAATAHGHRVAKEPASQQALDRVIRGTSMRRIVQAYVAWQGRSGERPSRVEVAGLLNVSESTLKRVQHDLGWLGWPPRPPEPDLP
jgi:hypothetical protein